MNAKQRAKDFMKILATHDDKEHIQELLTLQFEYAELHAQLSSSDSAGVSRQKEQ